MSMRQNGSRHGGTAIFFILLVLSGEVHAARIRHDHRIPEDAQGSTGSAKPPESAIDETKVSESLVAPLKVSPLMKMTDKEIAKQWRKENEVCVRKGSQCKEIDDVLNATSASGFEKIKQCDYQSIAGDYYSTSSCRLTDMYMLRGTDEKPITYWLTLQMRVLNSKARKYREGCQTWASVDWINYRCRRRLDHILRAARFISKAGKGPAFDILNVEEKEQVAQVAQDARRELAAVIFKGGSNSARKRVLLERLVQVSAADRDTLQKDPKAAIGRTLSIIENDLLPEDADTSVAEAKINEIVEIETQKQSKNNPAKLQRVQEFDAELIAESDDEFDKAMDEAVAQVETQVDEAQAEAVQSQNSSSFAQVEAYGRGARVVKWLGFSVVAVLTVMSIMYIGGVFMLGMIGYVGLAALGCTGTVLFKEIAYGNALGKMPPESMWRYLGPVPYIGAWVGCVASFVSLPFRAAYWVWKKAFRKKQIKTAPPHTRAAYAIRKGARY